MTDTNPTVVVTSDDALPDVVSRLRESAQGGRAVDLVVPIDSALLLTAREFRSLKDALDEHHLPVVVRTADPLRLQLAERLGVRAKSLPRPRVQAVPRIAVPVAVAAPPTAVAEEDWPGNTVSAEPVPRPDPDALWPEQNGSRGPDAEPMIVVESSPPPLSANPPRRWLPVAIALVALVAAAVVAIRYLVPQATIRVVPQSAAVASALVFDVTEDGAPIDAEAAFAIPAERRQIEVEWEGSVPVSGVRVEPDGTAASAIELRNAAAEPVTVDAGTRVATETGVEFAFAEAVTVPAADAASGSPGAATGQVTAVQAGSGGNVAVGELGGRLPNGVYYSNRMGPAAGGTDKEFPVVAQSDLDTLIAAAREAAPALAAEAVAVEQPGAKILANSVQIIDQSDAFDHDVGAEVADVALKAALTLDVLTFDGAAAGERYEAMLAQNLAADAPQGFAVGEEDIVFADPEVVEEHDGGARLEAAASAQAEAVLGDAERAALAAALAGASPEEAASILGQVEAIADFSVDYHPSWLAPRMPNTAARIHFEVAQ